MQAIATFNETDLGQFRFERTCSIPGMLWGETKTALRCYEFGATVAVGKSTRSVRFDDLAGISFSTINLFAPTGYQGTQYHIEFHPAGDSADKALLFDCVTTPIKKEGWFWSWTARTESTLVTDPDMENLRDELALLIARKMQSELESTGSVSWVPGVRLTRDGLEYLTGRQGTALLPFEEIAGLNAANGVFVIQNSREIVVSLEMISVNFFPGLLVLKTLIG